MVKCWVMRGAFAVFFAVICLSVTSLGHHTLPKLSSAALVSLVSAICERNVLLSLVPATCERNVLVSHPGLAIASVTTKSPFNGGNAAVSLHRRATATVMAMASKKLVHARTAR
jgi:hypothetical protein